MKINWCDKQSVIAYAKMIPDCVVFKHPDRNNFNITNKTRTDRYKKEWVVFTN